MKTIMTTPRILRVPVIALLPVLAFSLAGQALAAPPTRTDSTIQGDSEREYNLKGISQPAGSSVAARDKSGFTVTPPTLRPFDNFGAENAYTIGAGKVAVNEFFGYGWRQRSGDMVQRTDEFWNIAHTEVKYGILDNLDVKISISPWNIRTETLKDPTGQDSRTRSGFGDLMAGVDWNLWGNAGGPSALRVAATIQLPTASEDLKRRDYYAGGLSLQYERQFPCGFEVRVNSGFMLSESDRGCWNSCFNNRLVFYHPLIEELSAYGGFSGGVSTSQRADWEGEFLAGLIYQINHNFEISLGSTFGVNGDANDFGIGMGLAIRF